MKILLTLLLYTFVTLASAKTITVIIPFSPGGPTDQLWRSIEPSLNERLKQHGIRLVTENLPGAGGTIAANKIALTNDRLLLGFFSPALAVAPNTNPDIVKYHISNISLVGYAGATEMLVVSSITNEEFLEKCKNGRILFGSSNIGSTSHLMGSVVAKELNCRNAVHIPYKGQAPVYIDLITGRIDYLVDFSITAEGHILSGNVKRLFSVNERFPNNLENWHVLISNNFQDPDIEKIKNEFSKLKKEKEFVDELEKKLKIKKFSESKNQDWLMKEFLNYKNFINGIK